MPHVARDFDVLNLKIRDRRFKMGVPVHQTFAAVDQAFVVHLYEDFDDRIVKVWCAVASFWVTFGAAHREGLTVPVTRRAKTFQLTDDIATCAGFLFPNALNKGVTAHFGTGGFAVGGHFTLGNKLGCDTSVICACLPQCVVALHAFPADQDVLQRVVKCVPNVQIACDVGGRDHDRERLRARCVRTCFEGTAVLPCFVKTRLCLGCIESFVQCHRS